MARRHGLTRHAATRRVAYIRHRRRLSRPARLRLRLRRRALRPRARRHRRHRPRLPRRRHPRPPRTPPRALRLSPACWLPRQQAVPAQSAPPQPAPTQAAPTPARAACWRCATLQPPATAALPCRTARSPQQPRASAPRMTASTGSPPARRATPETHAAQRLTTSFASARAQPQRRLWCSKTASCRRPSPACSQIRRNAPWAARRTWICSPLRAAPRT